MPETRPDPETPRRLSWRDPVLWLVIGPPLGAVLGGFLTLWLAIVHRDPLVSETVRKVGVSWQEPAPAAPATPASTAAAAPPTVATPPAEHDGHGG